MKVVGLITEYNPFHNGHLYHIEETKKITNADYIVVIMSGNFVQRGVPAIMDKYLRTKIALSNGADLVIELPVCYATASAEFFALGAISTLDKLGFIDEVCFGSECGDINLLSRVAEILADEPFELSVLIADFVKSGMTYPLARANALLKYLMKKDINHNISSATPYPNNLLSETILEDMKDTLLSPNNILGIEYIKAIKRLGSKITPVTLQRKDSLFHDEELSETFSSATAIRKALHQNESLDFLVTEVPYSARLIMNEYYRMSYPITEKDFSLLLKYKLLQESSETLITYQDVKGGLEKRILNLLHNYNDFLNFAFTLKTKQITLTRITRALTHILLNVKTDSFEEIMKSGTVRYARILGFKKSSTHLIRLIKEQEQLTPITKMADAKELLDDIGNRMLDLDVFASDLYNSVVLDKFGFVIKNEYTHEIIIM